MRAAPTLLSVEEALAAAGRILAGDPRYQACRMSVDERVSVAVLALQQHDMIRAAGLSYPQAAAPAERREERA